VHISQISPCEISSSHGGEYDVQTDCRPTFQRCVLPPSSGMMMMEAVRTSETSADNYFTRQYIPEDSSEHHTRRRENLKSHILMFCLYPIDGISISISLNLLLGTPGSFVIGILYFQLLTFWGEIHLNAFKKFWERPSDPVFLQSIRRY
jgi:hypothetical protein